MSIFNVLIVDDEPYARRRLRKLLGEDSQIRLQGECASGGEAVSAIRKHRPDILFLDIRMPELDGFEVLDAVDRARIPAVVFVTAFDRHATRAFEAQALDYLLKPFDNQRFYEALERAKTAVQDSRNRRLVQQMSSLLEGGKKETAQELPRRLAQRLPIRSSGRIYFIRTDEIEWVQAAGKYVEIHVGPRAHLLRRGIGDLERSLDPGRFLRIHRSILVNLERVREVRPGFNGEFVFTLSGGQRLTSSRGYGVRIRGFLEGS